MKKILITIFIAVCLSLLYVTNSYFHNKAVENKKISFASWGSQSETAILKKLIQEYEQTSGIKVNFIHIPQNYFQKIQLLFASALEPDVVFFNNQYIKMYIDANLLEDLSPFFDTNKFFPEAVNCFRENERIYAIPRDISTLVVYYNKDILNKKGINPDKEFKDLNSFVGLLKQIKGKNYWSINFEENSLFWSYYLAAAGGGILTDDSNSLLITEPQSIKTLQLYSDLINKYNVIPTKAQVGSKTSAQMFINQEIAMYLSGRWMIPKFRETVDFNWDIMNFPSSEKNKLFLDASGWAVSKRSKNKKEAIDFIKYISSEDSLNKIASSGLIIPANINAARETIKNDTGKKPMHSHIFIDMIKNTKPTPINRNYASINDIITEKTNIIFSGNIKAEDAFDKQTRQQLERLLK